MKMNSSDALKHMIMIPARSGKKLQITKRLRQLSYNAIIGTSNRLPLKREESTIQSYHDSLKIMVVMIWLTAYFVLK